MHGFQKQKLQELIFMLFICIALWYYTAYTEIIHIAPCQLNKVASVGQPVAVASNLEEDHFRWSNNDIYIIIIIQYQN